MFGIVGQRIALNKGYYFFREYEYLDIKKDFPTYPPYCFDIKRGENVIPDSNIVLYFETPDEYEKRIKDKNIKINKLTKNILIKYNIINKHLYARSRREGDSYLCGGISRNVKKHMINEKIPSQYRSRIPIVYDEEGIVWVPGLGIVDRLKDNSGDVFSLSIYLK